MVQAESCPRRSGGGATTLDTSVAVVVVLGIEMRLFCQGSYQFTFVDVGSSKLINEEKAGCLPLLFQQLLNFVVLCWP